MEAAVAVKTDKEFLAEMLQIVDGTHWTKGTLACVNIVQARDAKGRLKYRQKTYHRVWNEDLWDYVKKVIKIPVPEVDPETGRVVTKPTACLVGIVLRVEGKPWDMYNPSELTETEVIQNALEQNAQYSVTEDGLPTLEVDESAFTEGKLGEQGHRICNKLLAHLYRNQTELKFHNGVYWMEELDKPQHSSRLRHVWSCLETWNDNPNTEKADVRKLIQITHDAEEAFAA